MRNKRILKSVVLVLVVIGFMGCASSKGSSKEAPYAFGSICEKNKEDGQKYNTLTISSYDGSYKNFRVTSYTPQQGDSVTIVVPAEPSILTPFGAIYREQCDEGKSYKVIAISEHGEQRVDVFYKQN
jgi:hypothetical protein